MGTRASAAWARCVHMGCVPKGKRPCIVGAMQTGVWHIHRLQRDTCGHNDYEFLKGSIKVLSEISEGWERVTAAVVNGQGN